MRILFIGNSYTLVNRMPRMLKELSRFAGNDVDVEVEAQREWALEDHATSKSTPGRICSEDWDAVILQEQSVRPASHERLGDMYPHASFLVEKAREAGAAPVFFLTWARRDGYLKLGMPDFETMQERLVEGYMEIANRLDVAVAPVGPAWKMALQERKDIPLWHDDGSHPSLAGSYLAACVFFSTLFCISPEDLPYTARLGGANAHFLQSVAARTVLPDPARWNLR